MKKDIPFPEVEGVHIAIARERVSSNNFEWYVFLINFNDFSLENILITSRGYGEIAGEKRKTSTLRHMINELEPNSYTLVEPIDPDVFKLCSEYWISYYVNSQIYDKKFIFLPESISEINISKINILNLEGVLHS